MTILDEFTSYEKAQVLIAKILKDMPIVMFMKEVTELLPRGTTEEKIEVISEMTKYINKWHIEER